MLRERARWKVTRALASGRLKKLPCEVCGSEKSEAHHKDYRKPLDVIFLCRKHHNKIHLQKRGVHETAVVQVKLFFSTHKRLKIRAAKDSTTLTSLIDKLSRSHIK